MMVAITVSSILMVGVIQLLVSNKQAYRIQEGASRLNETARFAGIDIAYRLRMADHWGGIATSDVEQDAALPAVANDCTQAGWSVYGGVGVEGYEGQATSPMQTCIPDANYVAGTDVVVARYADAQRVLTAQATSAPLDDDIYLRANVGQRAVIVQGDDITGLSADLHDPADPDAAGVYNYPYRIAAYFVRPCSAPGADGICNTADDVGDDIPTLVRLALADTALVQEEVVEGVEQLQAVYGVNTDGDVAGTADRYLTADNVSDWADVVSARLSLVVRNPERDVAADDTDVYRMVGGFNYTPPASVRQFARQLFHHVIQVRNRSRG
ncbi:MAG: hypothetical protein GWN84_21620 [Gammaproteobacteria bacterium]|nr:hypothetical protein [Gammaproteobacteria bacterium]NIR85321.1 hypothetical protein [Gammaproteobacteria bacterium]NIR88437.1 hypothetical protein [Gammaproteobacteria bacterium]NIU06387.1 hypothetical protein [Gammaproteobacteria bacterium]NIV53286.1 hypothetical protein [Gammaproteobacteria bacterium]